MGAGGAERKNGNQPVRPGHKQALPKALFGLRHMIWTSP